MKIPLGTLLTKHVRVTVLGTFIMLATYTLFYIMTVYSMTFSTAAAPVGLGLPRNEVLWMLMMAVIGFGVMVPVAGLLADAFGRRKSMVIITTLIILFALFAFTLCSVLAARFWFCLSAAGVKSDGADLRSDGRAVTRAVPDRSALHRSIVLLQRIVDSRGFRCAVYRSLVAD